MHSTVISLDIPVSHSANGNEVYETRIFTVHHNGDWSGDIKISRTSPAFTNPDEFIELPFELLKHLVGRYINDVRIAVMENTPGNEIVEREAERL